MHLYHVYCHTVCVCVCVCVCIGMNESLQRETLEEAADIVSQMAFKVYGCHSDSNMLEI